MITAILLDHEARHGYQTFPESFGKLREPILRITHLWRAFPVIPVARVGTFYGGNRCGQGEYDFYRMPYSGLNRFEEYAGANNSSFTNSFQFFLTRLFTSGYRTKSEFSSARAPNNDRKYPC